VARTRPRRSAATAGRIGSAVDPSGQTFAVSIVDGGSADAAGLDLSFFGGPHAVAPCERVPPYLAIDRGNYAVTR
jgi:hypothetical protein